MKRLVAFFVLFTICISPVLSKASPKKYKTNEIKFEYPSDYMLDEDIQEAMIMISGGGTGTELFTILYQPKVSQASIDDYILNSLQDYVNDLNLIDFLYGDNYNSTIGKYDATAVNFSYSLMGAKVYGIIKVAIIEKNVLAFMKMNMGEDSYKGSQIIEKTIEVDPKAFSSYIIKY